MYTMGENEYCLCNALIELTTKLADENLSQGSFLASQILLSMKLLDHIVDLAHHHKILNFNSLRAQISWVFMDSHGSSSQILPSTIPDTIHHHSTTAMYQHFRSVCIRIMSTKECNSAN